MTRFILPVEKHEHARPCQPCGGTGVTGERYEMPAGEHILLAEVICPACDGCGNGDPGHAGCKPEWHAEADDDGLYPDYPDDEDEEGEEGDGAPACWSCGSGRGWNAVQGFRGEGEDVEMLLTRVPCGCSESRLVEAGDD